ncbi:MAG: hypothetical protein EOO88_12285 [Pedobacter sp.]|nr:MAG: hypothetical protein EOO88_12285 [Pedobacter sp.]
MKTKIILAAIALIGMFSACEKREYQLGLPEYDHHYYIAYVPYNNTQVTVNKTQATLLKFEVSFNSSFTRSYDAIAQYRLTPATIAGTTAAVLGTDFNVVDRSGNVINPVDGKYSITFPKATKARDTIYIKLLNNPAPGPRSVNVDLIENVTSEYRVDTMSVAFRRPIRIN